MCIVCYTAHINLVLCLWKQNTNSCTQHTHMPQHETVLNECNSIFFLRNQHCLYLFTCNTIGQLCYHFWKYYMQLIAWYCFWLATAMHKTLQASRSLNTRPGFRHRLIVPLQSSLPSILGIHQPWDIFKFVYRNDYHLSGHNTVIQSLKNYSDIFWIKVWSYLIFHII